MKKLLLLLVFSASLFASAQTVNVHELSTVASGTFVNVFIDNPNYGTEFTLTSSETIEFTSANTVIVNGMSHSSVDNAIQLSTALFSGDVGGDYLTNLAAFQGGFWYQRNAGIFSRVDNPVAVDPLQTIASSPGWSVPTGSNVLIRNACDQTFSVRHLTSNEAQRFVLNRIRGGYFEERYATAEEVISAVNRHLTESSPLCDATINHDEYGWELQPSPDNTFQVSCRYIFTITWDLNLEMFNVVRFDPAGTTLAERIETTSYSRTSQVRRYIQDHSILCELASSGEWNEPTESATTLARLECNDNRYYVATEVDGIIQIRYGSSIESANTRLYNEDGEDFGDAVTAGDAVRDHSCNIPN